MVAADVYDALVAVCFVVVLAYIVVRAITRDDP